jgi:hypothetical protein
MTKQKRCFSCALTGINVEKQGRIPLCGKKSIRQHSSDNSVEVALLRLRDSVGPVRSKLKLQKSSYSVTAKASAISARIAAAAAAASGACVIGLPTTR